MMALPVNGHSVQTGVPSPSKKVMIIGAGSTGLSLAQGLKKVLMQPILYFCVKHGPTCTNKHLLYFSRRAFPL